MRSVIPISVMEYVPPHFDAPQQKDAEEKLASIAAGIELGQDRVSSTVRVGAVYNEVLQEAEKTNADLIIVGSHRPSMAGFLLGSNASTIVRHAKCSVLVVRGSA